MSYFLTFATKAEAQSLVAAATALVPGLPGLGGAAVWDISDSADGQSVVEVAETAVEAGLGLDDGTYTALLSLAEGAGGERTDTRPSPAI